MAIEFAPKDATGVLKMEGKLWVLSVMVAFCSHVPLDFMAVTRILFDWSEAYDTKARESRTERCYALTVAPGLGQTTEYRRS